MPRTVPTPDRYALYSAAAQNVEADLTFARRIYRRRHGVDPRRLREDFCGTARLACAWVRDRPERRAWGVDLDPVPLAWGERHYRQALGDQAARVELRRGNVLTARTPPADLALALNFSYCIFKERALLRRYLRRARTNLAAGGALIMDIFGGTGAITATRETKIIRAARGPDGKRLPPFRFTWEHAHFDAASHHVRCHMHFAVLGGRRLPRAFTYDWRLWTIPEIRELLREAGFAEVEVYTHGWTRNGRSDDVYRRVTRFDNEIGWLAYVVGWT